MPFPTHWGIPPLDLSTNLGPDTVHVWRIVLDDSPERASCYRADLSPSELARADRCRIPYPQFQFIVIRGILRQLLSRYVGIPAKALQFEKLEHGKPALTNSVLFPVQFNVSHTKDLALIAITSHHAVGVDVERIDRTISDHEIAKRYFSTRESSYLSSLTPAERSQQFFSLWTCKEAYLKMQGTGITGGLAKCEIVLDPHYRQGEPLRWIQHDAGEPIPLHSIQAGPAHVGAVAIDCSSVKILFYHWSDADQSS